MPICYEIAIAIVREDAEGEQTVRPLPLKITVPRIIGNLEIGERVREHVERFQNIMGQYPGKAKGEYSYGGEFVLTAVYEC